LGIVDTIAQVLEEYAQQPTPDPSGPLTLADVVEAETWARTRARQIIEAGVAVTDGEGRS
jgi:1-deoxy-D-xylulose-5-phosphate reductoisomerase